MLLFSTMLNSARAAAANSNIHSDGGIDDNSSALINFDDPVENLRAFIKLTGSLDPSEDVAGWFGGTIYAVIGDNKKVEPLIGVEGCGMLRIEPQGNNVYRVFNREFAIYKDLKTGEYLDQWKNPYTNEIVDVFPIQNLTVTAEIAPIVKQEFDGTVVEFPFTPPWIVQGGKAFSIYELHAAFPNPMTPDKWPRESAGPINRTSEMFNRAANYAELADPDLAFADYTGTWIRLGPWLPWMLMGQQQGHLLYRTFMQRIGNSRNLPPKLLTFMERKYPDFLVAPPPSSWDLPNDSSFSVYMEKRSPVKLEK